MYWLQSVSEVMLSVLLCSLEEWRFHNYAKAGECQRRYDKITALSTNFSRLFEYYILCFLLQIKTWRITAIPIATMGVGRRMQKQGPPPDLGKISTQKKRKISDIDDNLRGKKRKASGDIKEPAPARKHNNGKTNSGLKYFTKGTFVDDGTIQPRKGRKMAKKPEPMMSGALLDGDISSDDDAADLLGDWDNSEDDVPLDDFSGSVGSVDEEGLDDEDGFLDSGSSVYDSDLQLEKARFSDDEDESDAEEKLTAANIEGLSRKLDEKQEEVAAEAQLELEEAALQTNIDGDRPKVLDDDDDGPNARLAPDLQLLRTRITDTIRVLDDFSKLSEEGRSRAEYTAQLLKDICIYYGYSPYLADKLFNLFPPREAFAFFEANETARPVVIRTNTLRTHRRELAQSLISRGVTLEPVGKWSKVGLQVFESQVPLGATPEYLAGHYILQAASSFLPVMALAPQEHERILDMASAPGGKATYIAALMKNTGTIFANDSNKARAKGLIGNIHRLGVRNTIVCNHDAREFPKVIGGFDRVLLDAPCSGTGVIAKDPSVKTNKNEKDFMQLPHLQKQLLLSAIDSVDHSSKTGGYIVYSTCSVTVEENEQVVQYALSKRPNVKLVETGLIFGVNGFVSYMGKQFDPRMKMTKRYYPHAYNVDGFFVSKFKKVAPSPGRAAKDGVTEGMRKEGVEQTNSKTPVLTDEGGEEVDEFGGFDDSEDEKYMEKAERNRLRRKGLDPRALEEKKQLNGSVKPTEGKEATNGVPASNGRESSDLKAPVGSTHEVRAATTRVE